MRVLEGEITVSYSMGKNKHKLQKHREYEISDSSEDVNAKGCAHVNKAINFGAMKKGLAKQTLGECAGCAKKGEAASLIDRLEGATSEDYTEPVDPSLWVCLQCGNQGCDRLSPEKHALKHYEAPRSSQHNIVINTSNWLVWCYECDCEIPASKSKKVSECLEFLQKQVSGLVGDAAQGRAVSSNNQSGNGGVLDTNKSRAVMSRPLSGGGCTKVKGLSNLGNTCFFNAVMQNVVQTHMLESLMTDRRKGAAQCLTAHWDCVPDSSSGTSSDDTDGEKHSKHVYKELGDIEITLVEPGPLTTSLVVFLHEVNTASKSGCINPSGLFSQICKKATRFRGMQQQDSQELLRYLLDNMKTEEIKRAQAGILKHFRLSENTKPKNVDEETKHKVKTYGLEAKHTFVDCLFGGQLISTVICEECKYISQILEPFLDLSLPVMEEKPQRPNMSHKGVSKEPDPGDLDLVKPQVAKDEAGPSKHMSKKQKKNKKRDARRHGGHGKGKAGGANKEGEEEKGEEPGKEGEEHQEEDSDADIEDNLESDTSKCNTKSASDSISPDEQGTSQLPHNSNIDTEYQGTCQTPRGTHDDEKGTNSHDFENTSCKQETSLINEPGTSHETVTDNADTQGTNNENNENSNESIEVISDDNSDNETAINAGMAPGQFDCSSSRTHSEYTRLGVVEKDSNVQNYTQPEQQSLKSSHVGERLDDVSKLAMHELSSDHIECTINNLGANATIDNNSVTDSNCISSINVTFEDSSNKPNGINDVNNTEGSNGNLDGYVVNYTVTNGHLSETPSTRESKTESSIETSFTFHCSLVGGESGADVESNKCLVDSETSSEVSKCDGSKVSDSPMVNGDLGLVNGVLENGEGLSDSENVTHRRGVVEADTEMGDSVESSTLEMHTEASSDISTLTSDVSALSVSDLPERAVCGSDSADIDIGPAEQDVLINEISKLCIKSENVDRLESDVKMSQRSADEDRVGCASQSAGVTKGSNCVQGGPHREKEGCNGQSRSSNVLKQLDMKHLFQEGKKKSVNTLAERYQVSSGECSIQSCLNQFTAAELLTGHNKFGCKNCTKLKFKNNPKKEKKDTVYSNANKQYLIFQTPAVLTLHLKRFEQVGFSSRKVNRHVDFPFVLDIAPYCSHLTQGIKAGQKKILYSLYGVVEHSGRLNAGHYTAYVKVRPNIGTLDKFLNKHNVSLKEYLTKYAEMVMNGATQEVDPGPSVNTEALVPPGRWYHISDARVNEVTEATVEHAQAYLLFYERIY